MAEFYEFLEEYVLNKLSQNERIVVFFRQKDAFGFGENGLTLKQIGKEIGVSPERVRQILLKAIRKINYRLYLIKEAQKPQHILIKEIAPPEGGNALMVIKNVTDLGELSARTTHCLMNLGVLQLDKLMRLTEADLLAVPNFGKKSLRELKALLATHGLAFNQPLK